MIEILEPTREERASALDRFAGTSAPEGGAMIPAQSMSVAGDRVIGAQPVAVHRDEARVLTRLRALAAAAGDDWYYRFPVKNRRENRVDYIEGPSIKLANDLARIYGNCGVSMVRCLDLGGEWQFLYRFVDYESGYDYERPWRQTKGASRLGGDDAERRLDIAFQIGASKAIRNVITNALQTYADFAFQEARRALVDKIGNDLVKWRARTVERLSEHVDIRRVERVVGRKVNEWLAPDVAKVIAMGKAVQDGMASMDETFPPLEAPKPEPGAAGPDQLDRFAKGEERGDGAPADQAAAKKRGRPTKAEAEAKKAAQDAQEGGQGDQAGSAGEDSGPAASGVQGVASGFAREIEEGIAGEDRAKGPAESPRQFAANLIAQMDKAKTPEEVNQLAAEARPLIRRYPDEQTRMDLSAISYAYQQFAGQAITEADLEREVAHRLDMIDHQ